MANPSTLGKIACEHLSEETIVPVRIGFIGAGGIAQAHFNTLSQISDAQLVSFCDVAAERAEGAARRFEGKAYTDPRKMLEAETLDAVYVCLPPHAHKNAEILVAQKGCALFVEKPLANSMKWRRKSRPPCRTPRFSRPWVITSATSMRPSACAAC
jgi:hypothetical protein